MLKNETIFIIIHDIGKKIVMNSNYSIDLLTDNTQPKSNESGVNKYCYKYFISHSEITISIDKLQFKVI